MADLYSYKGAYPGPLPSNMDQYDQADFTLVPDKPTAQPGQVIEWTGTAWNVREPNASELEIQWQKVKNQRDWFLDQTSQEVQEAYAAGVDLPLELKLYRRALNAITDQSNPFDIKWPSRGIEWTAENPPTPEAVNDERQRRLKADFAFNGVMYQRDPVSIQRISGAASLAGFAIGQGAQPGDFLWHGGTQPFTWIGADNSLNQMDAQTTFAFGQAAAAQETAIVFAAKTLREMDPIPLDFADDIYWP